MTVDQTPVVLSNSSQLISSNTADVPRSVIAWCANLVETCHKQVAAVLGLLVAGGIIGVPAGPKVGAGLFLGYAAIAHIADNLFHTKKFATIATDFTDLSQTING